MTERQPDKETNIHTVTQINRHRDTHKQKDKDTDRERERKKGGK